MEPREYLAEIIAKLVVSAIVAEDVVCGAADRDVAVRLSLRRRMLRAGVRGQVRADRQPDGRAEGHSRQSEPGQRGGGAEAQSQADSAAGQDRREALLGRAGQA